MRIFYLLFLLVSLKMSAVAQTQTLVLHHADKTTTEIQ